MQAVTSTQFTRKEIDAERTPENSAQQSIIALSRSEYEKVTRKFTPLQNVGVAPFAPLVVQSGEVVELPQRAIANYNDGSTKELAVVWNEDEVLALETATKGTYTIHGTIDQPQYASPLVRGRADPWVFKGEDSYYYFTATYPMQSYDDPHGHDRIILRRATTVEGLATAEEIVVWDEDNTKNSFRWIWAPEIHYINGEWVIFFTASAEKSNVWGIRPHIITCNRGDKNPMNPECWEVEASRIRPVSVDNTSFSNFSLDMTHFVNNGVHYVVWAQIMGQSSLAIASVDAMDLSQLTSPYTLLTKPEYAWEWDKEWVNEAAAVIHKNDKIYLVFSASSVNHTYCVGLLYADKDSDLLDPNSWTKVRYPILSSEDLPVEQNGPGHNSFTVDKYGNPIIIFHARNPSEDPTGGGLYDAGRHAFVKGVNFAFDGTPILYLTPEQELDPKYKAVSIEVTIK